MPGESYIRLDPKDNVIVALQDLPPGTVINAGDRVLEVIENIPAKHKLFIDDLDLEIAILSRCQDWENQPGGDSNGKLWRHYPSSFVALTGKAI